jgi:hypothetical protein
MAIVLSERFSQEQFPIIALGLERINFWPLNAIHQLTTPPTTIVAVEKQKVLHIPSGPL